MSEATSNVVNAPAEVESLGQAYERALERIRQVPESDLMHINIDVPTAVTTVVGSLREIRLLRAEMEKVLPGPTLADMDMLETYAYALLHLHTRWSVMLNPPDVLADLMLTATRMRELFISHISTLAMHGLLDGAVLRTLKGTTGHKNIAVDLAGMSALLRESWPTVGGKTALQLSDLDAADKLVKQVFHAIGLKEQAPVVLAALTLDRQRAFKLLVETYNQVRRAVSFLRWDKGDVEDIAPSLYAGRGGRRRRADTEPQQPTPPQNSAPAKPQPSAPVGHPDSDPFAGAV